MHLSVQHIERIQELCATHSVKHLFAFGSVVTDDFNSDSDVDLIVEFLPVGINRYADNYFDLKYALEETLQRKIDLLEERALKNPYFIQAVNEKKQLIYAS